MIIRPVYNPITIYDSKLRRDDEKFLENTTLGTPITIVEC